MADYTDNYGLIEPTYAELADIDPLNGNFETIDEIMHASQVSLADAYDLTATYNTGDVVMYQYLMYKCKEDNVTGAWDASKWERTTAGEEGAGGGGTSVVPNPQGEPTDTLNTIGIDGTIFDIAGSGGGSAYTETLLYEDTSGAVGTSNITLTDSLDNYDALYFEYFFPNESTYVESTPSPLIPLIETPLGSTKGKYYISIYPTYGSRYMMLSSDGSTSATLITGTWSESIRPSVYRIHGIKFGAGGSGSGVSMFTLYNTFTSSIGEITLNDDVENYDFIMIDFGFNGSDKAHNNIYLPAKDFSNKYPYVSTPSNTDPHVILNPYDNQFARMIMGSDSNKLYIFEIGQTVGIYGVYGLKWTGGGNSGRYSETSLYTYTGSTRQTTLSLSDNYTDYDAIEFTFGWNFGGSSFETVNVISSSKIVSNVFVNVGGEGRYNYISRGSADNEIILATAAGSWDGSSIIREVRGINY